MLARPRRSATIFLLSLWASPLFAATAAAVDFQRQVRPILSENCFRCHGPDQGTRMAGLRLDTKEGAFSARKNGVVVAPGKPDESLMIQRVFAGKATMRMPPADSHKVLTTEQKDLLRRWIQQGANWKEHWAFVAPVRPALPAVHQSDWVRNPIDRFIMAKLEAKGLHPAPEADRRTLIRRVTLDLTGLPPSPSEVDALLNDRSVLAYENVVDRLLNSPRYGEHRGRYWLDVARYGDTHGLHIDNYRDIWPYRDWVIDAFNRNLPFDRFTIDQLAGDLIPNATLEEKVASGFQRCNVTTSEGGSIEAEVAAMYAKDRADTMGTVWMGLTVGCATCHDHKYDPISAKDYYSLTAFFRNTTQKPLDGNISDTPPAVLAPRLEDRGRWHELNNARLELIELIRKEKDNPGPDFEEWLHSPERRQLAETTQGVLDEALLDPAKLPAGIEIAPGLDGTGQALRFGKDASIQLQHVSEVDADKPFTIAAWVWAPKSKGRMTIASQFGPEPMERPKRSGERRKGWSLDFSMQEGPKLRMVGDEGKSISSAPIEDSLLTAESWHHLVFTYDGSRDRRGLELYIDGKSVSSHGAREDDVLTTLIGNDAPLSLGQDNKTFFAGGAIAEFRILNHRVDEQQAELLFLRNVLTAAATKDAAELSRSERSALATSYVRKSDASRRLSRLDVERTAIARRGSFTLVMQERSDATPVAHVLFRGQYDAPRDEVPANTPSVLPPMPASYPRNRMGLARWLVDPENPLTARATVNRLWQEVFGSGIVKTVEDFGSQGDAPVNPELLDWLAVEFRESGWDMKKYFRLMVTSAAYRQSSQTTREKLARDPENRLLSRGPRFRMDAEMIRDLALAASGLLNPEIGGPSVRPYQPANLWEVVAMESSNTRFYQRDTGNRLYRRSMYTFWKRSAPPASLDIFNAPTRETCLVRRERADTPLQALVTMNDEQFVEAARQLAQNAVLAARENLDSEIDFMSERLISRNLSAKERKIVARSYKDYLQYYDGQPQDAAKLLSVGESKTDPALPKAELAALTMVANELLNLDEVLVK